MPEEVIQIESLTKKGDGLSYLNNTPIEIPHTIPGDTVLADLRKKRKGKIKARLLKLLKNSPSRIDPTCDHAFICGGCTFHTMLYSKQLEFKEKFVLDQFKDLISKQNVTIYPIIPSSQTFHYRNKMEFSFSQNKANTKFLGLMIARARNFVFNVNKCFLSAPWFSEVLTYVRAFWESSSILAYNHQDDTGSLRSLTIREAYHTKEKMVILTISGNKDYALSQLEIETFKQTILSVISENISIFLRIQTIKPKTPTTFKEVLLHGKEHITEKIYLKTFQKEFSFNISPSSFFQPSTLQAEILYEKAYSIIQQKLSNQKLLIYDLYCGTGTLSMIFSSLASQVIAIELNEKAIIDAKKNLLLNNINNVTFHQGDVGKVLTSLMAKDSFQKPDLIIVDPPRSGLDDLALHHIKILQPKYILYISCNPITQSKDIENLSKDYSLECLQPLDQFAHTPHVENIALLSKLT